MDYKSRKIEIRQGNMDDIPAILDVERDAWGEESAATKEMFESRIKIFPQGVLVAVLNKEIVGVVAVEKVNYDLEKNAYSWYEITDNGFIKKSHKENGDSLYGVDLSVRPSFQRLGIGKKLLEGVADLAIRLNLKQGLLGGRIPGFHKYSDKMNVEDYASLEKDGKPLDPEIRFYKKSGLKIIKIISDYYKDPDSLNYGVLLQWKNPLYNKWYRHIFKSFLKIQ